MAGFVGIDAVRMLFLSAVANGVLAPPLVLVVLLLTSDRRVMGKHTNPPWSRAVGWIAFLTMTAGAIAMFVFPR